MFKNLFSIFLFFNFIFFNTKTEEFEFGSPKAWLHFTGATFNCCFSLFTGIFECINNLLNSPEKFSNETNEEQIIPKLWRTWHKDLPQLKEATMHLINENKDDKIKKKVHVDFFYKAYFPSSNSIYMNAAIALTWSWLAYRFIQCVPKFKSMFFPGLLLYLLLLNQCKNKS